MQEGFYVDDEHLAAQDSNAQADLRDAERRFRSWLRRYGAVIGAGAEEYGLHPDAVPDLVNMSSSSQMQTLLFGGFTAANAVEKKPLKAEAAKGAKPKLVKPKVEIVRPTDLPTACKWTSLRICHSDVASLLPCRFRRGLRGPTASLAPRVAFAVQLESRRGPVATQSPAVPHCGA